MGKLYDHQYMKPGGGSAGTMICPTCRNHIDGQHDEWRCAKRNKDGDWGYVTHHRNCCADDPQWAINDAAESSAKRRWAKLKAEVADLVERYPEFSIADLLGDDE
jgi:hypothetical protein